MEGKRRDNRISILFLFNSLSFEMVSLRKSLDI